MGQHIYQVDALTDTPFAGNPAAVCVMAEPASERWMQDVAREMNLSETAFLVGSNDGYSLRWFTPVVEVDLCGHTTLASAHVLWETGESNVDETIRFHTRSGLLSATRDGDWVELDYPATPVTPCDPPTSLRAYSTTWWRCPLRQRCARSPRISERLVEWKPGA